MTLKSNIILGSGGLSRDVLESYDLFKKLLECFNEFKKNQI